MAKINRHIANNSWSNTPLKRWCVGTNDNPNRRESEYYGVYGTHIRNYAVFYAYSKKIASQVENYFASKGITRVVDLRSASGNARWVYVYKLPLF